MRIQLFSRFSLVAIFAAVAVSSPANADEDPIDRAIKKGAKYLQGANKPDKGADKLDKFRGMGTATLAGLALLESGVPETDPALRNITRYIRDNALAQTRTYEISLTIMFLDRLGQSADRPIIQFLGVRLMAGQGGAGGWSYECGYGFTDQDEARLKRMFIKESRLVSAPSKKDLPAADPVKKQPAKTNVRPDLPPAELPAPPEPKTGPAQKGPPAVAKPADNKVAKPADEKPALHPEVLRWAKLINQNAAKDGGGGFGFAGGDNSNTQFATLGLWCARKHGVPCEKSLALLDTRFRTSQGVDGGWGYTYVSGGGGSTAAMTCAGLIGLAVAHGSQQSVLKNKVDAPAPKKAKANPKKGPVEPADDEAIKNGLKCLGNYITDAKGMPPEGIINRERRRRKRFKIDDLNGNLYFLWSLERTAMIYGLATIGKHDWYTWGADALLDSQNADGSWSSNRYPGATDEISTCFALLFLNRANVARDLSKMLQGKISDPGVAVLRGGDLSKILPNQVPPKTEPKRDPMPAIEPRPGPMTSPPGPTGNDFNAEAARLAVSLLNAAGEARSTLIARLRDSKGSVNTEALARAAAQASGEVQQEIRAALARRLARMTRATLRDMLKDDNREVRRAAALACGHKEDRQFIADLIDALSDKEDLVVQATRTSLGTLTGIDLGPEPAATPADRLKALQAWISWWKERKK